MFPLKESVYFNQNLTFLFFTIHDGIHASSAQTMLEWHLEGLQIKSVIKSIKQP